MTGTRISGITLPTSHSGICHVTERVDLLVQHLEDNTERRTLGNHGHQLGFPRKTTDDRQRLHRLSGTTFEVPPDNVGDPQRKAPVPQEKSLLGDMHPDRVMQSLMQLRGALARPSGSTSQDILKLNMCDNQPPQQLSSTKLLYTIPADAEAGPGHGDALAHPDGDSQIHTEWFVPNLSDACRAKGEGEEGAHASLLHTKRQLNQRRG